MHNEWKWSNVIQCFEHMCVGVCVCVSSKLNLFLLLLLFNFFCFVFYCVVLWINRFYFIQFLITKFVSSVSTSFSHFLSSLILLCVCVRVCIFVCVFDFLMYWFLLHLIEFLQLLYFFLFLFRPSPNLFRLCMRVCVCPYHVINECCLFVNLSSFYKSIFE